MGRKIVDLKWVGGEHDFALYLGEIEALQQRCDAGPDFILGRISDGSWRQEHLFETIRQGLIGGGMPAHDARKIVDNVRDDHPLRAFVLTAQVILAAALVGVEDDPVGELEGENEDLNTPEENGSSQGSTAQEPS